MLSHSQNRTNQAWFNFWLGCQKQLEWYSSSFSCFQEQQLTRTSTSNYFYLSPEEHYGLPGKHCRHFLAFWHYQNKKVDFGFYLLQKDIVPSNEYIILQSGYCNVFCSKVKIHSLVSFIKAQTSMPPTLLFYKLLSMQKLMAPPVLDMLDGLRTIWKAWLVRAVKLPRGLTEPRLASQATSLLGDFGILFWRESLLFSCWWIVEQGGEQGGCFHSSGHSLSQSASHLSRARSPGFICAPPGWSSS